MRAGQRGRVAFSVLIGLIVFLLASNYHEFKGRGAADRRRDQAIAALALSNRQIVDKLAEVLERTIRAETAALEAGQTPAVRVEDILDQVKGIDQALISEALQKAYKAVAGATGATGARGPAGPAGPPGAAAATSTTAAPAGTTTTSRHPATSTSSSSTTTTRPTTRPCTLGVLGACVLRSRP